MSKRISFKNMGEIRTFLGCNMSINKENKTLFISQLPYTNKVLHCYMERRLKSVNTLSIYKKILILNQK